MPAGAAERQRRAASGRPSGRPPGRRSAVSHGRREARAIQRGTRQSPYKMRLVIDQIRGKDVNEALALLTFSKKHAAKQIAKMLKSRRRERRAGGAVDERVARRGRAVREARDHQRRAEAQAVHAGRAWARDADSEAHQPRRDRRGREGRTLMGQKTNPIGFRLGITQAVALALVRGPRAARRCSRKTSCCGSISRRASGTRRSPTSSSSASRARSS